jgi:hypothetical protein
VLKADELHVLRRQSEAQGWESIHRESGAFGHRMNFNLAPAATSVQL